MPLGKGRPSASCEDSAKPILASEPALVLHAEELVLSVSARKLSRPPRGSSWLTSLLKCRLRWPGLDFLAVFLRARGASAGPRLLPHVGGSLGPFNTEIVSDARKAHGPIVQFPFMASLLKILPRKLADARILQLIKCFQKGYISIFNVSTNQNMFICIYPKLSIKFYTLLWVCTGQLS